MAITVRVNERSVTLDAPSSLADARSRCKPDADVLICNGFPCPPEHPLVEGDTVVLIRRGEVPGPDELEALLVSRHTPGVHTKIKHARVGVAGLGGLGSQVAIALGRVGVGTLVLADFDVVEPSNLNRQQYFVEQLGLPKVTALADTLKRVNPYVRLETHAVRLTPENIPSIYRDCRVLVEAFDRADQKAMLVETALGKLTDTWVVAASGLAGYDSPDTIRTHRIGAKLVVVGDLTQAARPGMGLMAPRVGVAAHAQANTALRILLGEEQ